MTRIIKCTLEGHPEIQYALIDGGPSDDPHEILDWGRSPEELLQSATRMFIAHEDVEMDFSQ